MRLMLLCCFVISVIGCGSKKNVEEENQTPSGIAETEKGSPQDSNTPSQKEVKKVDVVKVDLKLLKLAKEGWDGDYNESMESWTYEKYVPGEDDMNELGGRFYVEFWGEDTTSDLDEYAKKLNTEKGFQDMGYIWPTISKKEKVSNGWAITGECIDKSDSEAKIELAFVVYLEKFNISCRGTVAQANLLEEAVSACKEISF